MNVELNRQPTTGVIARYARFDDYHDVLGERLKQLTAFIDLVADRKVRSLWYVDTGPLLERDFAQRAGLGFVGKHTNLISRKFGNWIFLCGNHHHARTRTGRAGEKSLRQMHALHRRLPDERHHRAVPTGRAPLHFLSDD